MKSYGPSQIACSAAKLRPTGARRYTEAFGRCVLCGTDVLEGDIFEPASSGLRDTFTNYWKGWNGSSSDPICGHCCTLTENSTVFLAKNALITPTRSWAMNSDAQRAWCFHNLPRDEPYLITISNANSQHLIWRAPVNTSADIVFIRYGEKIGMIRMGVVREAVDRATKLGLLLRDEIDIEKKGMISPFKTDRKFKGCESGEWYGWIQSYLDEKPSISPNCPAFSPDPSSLPYLQTLTPSEAWALGFMIKNQNPGDLEEPVPAF